MIAAAIAVALFLAPPPAGSIAVPTPLPLLAAPQPTPDACNVPALILVPAVPVLPAAAQHVQTALSADLDVRLDEKGAVTGVEIANSSGRDDVDAAATDAAQRSTYAPQKRGCRAIPSTYRFHVQFAPP